MKTLTTFFLAVTIGISISIPTFSQIELWGTTSTGGDDGLGTVFKTNYDGSNFQTINIFSSTTPGKQPYGGLLRASNNKLYGYNSSGGQCGYGNLFSYDLNFTYYSVLIDFDLNTMGGEPHGQPIQGSNGKLYGATSAGGSNGLGTLFEYDPTNQSFIVLTDFAGLDFGCDFAGGIIEATNGKFYGLGSGGTAGYGVIYEYDLAVGTPVKIYEFPASGLDGVEPWGELIQATNGLLYGMTANGGLNGYGVIFEFDIATSTFTKKIDLTNLTGRYPYGSLMQASSGLIYGMTNEAGTGQHGTLFEYDPIANSIATRINFGSTPSVGDFPWFGVVCETPNGNLYGMTSDGGANSAGVIFEYNPITQTATTKLEFDGTNGYYPTGSLVLGPDSILYGLTQSGGQMHVGNMILFDYITNNWSVPVDLNTSIFGICPAAALTVGQDNKLYGLMQYGGFQNVGDVYQIDPISGISSVFWPGLTNANGGYSVESGAPPMLTELCAASNGKLYGVTSDGGSNSEGAIFEKDLITYAITLNASFASGSTGANPGPGLIQATDGKLYGVCRSGGTNNVGTLFSYDIATNTLVKLFDFDNTNGANPNCILSELSPGRIYGVTNSGGANLNGLIFHHDIVSGTTVKLNDFTTAMGKGNGSLLAASNGLIYGMRSSGGTSGQGCIYSFDTTSQVITKLVDFSAAGISKYTPGKLIQVSGGKILGMHETAGNNEKGILFEFDIASNTYSVKKDFGCTDGTSPASSGLTIYNTQSSSLVWPGDCDYNLIVDNTDFLWTGLSYGATGLTRVGATNNWTGQTSGAWIYNFGSAINYKHADCNGDGIINMSDTLAISLNYGQTHPLRTSNPVSAVAVSQIKMIANTDSIAPGSAIDFDIYLADSSTPLDSLYGIALSFNFDSSLVDASQTSVTWSPSVLGIHGTNMQSFGKYFAGAGRLETAITRIDHNNVVNIYGIIGRLHLVASTSINTISTLTVTPSNVTGITLEEQSVSFATVSDSVVVDPALIGLNEFDNGYGIHVFPNPATEEIHINSTGSSISEITISDIRGSVVLTMNPESNQIVIPVKTFPQGNFFIQLVTEKGTVHKRVFVN